MAVLNMNCIWSRRSSTRRGCARSAAERPPARAPSIAAKKGTKYTSLVDRDGVPLVIRAVPANRSDPLEILPTVVSFLAVPGKPGRPRTHPEKPYADAGYDCEATRSLLGWLGIEPHIRRRNGDHGSYLGRVRWVVERTMSWVIGLRRMCVRYDRSTTSFDAWTSIAAAVACLNILVEATTYPATFSFVRFFGSL